MSDVGSRTLLSPGVSQFPVEWYFDEKLFEPRFHRLQARPRRTARVQLQLEDLHRGLPRGLPRRPFHPGLGSFVTCDDLRWEFGDWYSVQTVGINSLLAKPARPVYQRWHEAVLEYYNGELPKHGAIWLTYYPNIMVEWYPHVLVVSTLIPEGPHKTLNVVEFYYPEEIAAFEREFVEAEQAAYMETCDRGRRDRRAHGRRPPRADGARRQRGRPLPVARWKTACSTSTSWP
jgi:hypothetical protein